MSFGTQDSSDQVMNEINMTPLVDVMLVLLIIFIITVPVMKHSVNVDLPQGPVQLIKHCGQVIINSTFCLLKAIPEEGRDQHNHFRDNSSRCSDRECSHIKASACCLLNGFSFNTKLACCKDFHLVRAA